MTTGAFLGNKLFGRGVGLLLALAAGLSAWGQAPAAGAGPVDAELNRRWRGIRDAGAGMESRGVFGFALEATAAGWHPDYVERALAIVAPLQDRDPASKTYGNFRWAVSNPRVLDPNAVEFCLQQGALLRLKYYEGLTPRSQRLLDEMLELGIEGMTRHRVPVSYTNIFLMKLWNRIGLGEAIGRDKVADEGYAMLEEWLKFTAQNGITEYNSPNYYGVDLESLGLVARFGRRPAGRAQAEAALRLFWSELAAHWYEPGMRLSGANSRCYQYLEGRGHLDDFLQLEGWQSAGKPPVLTAYLQACRWAPPADVTEPLRAMLPRTVIQRWGADAWLRAVDYRGREFSVGSTGANNNADDRALVVNLGRSPKVPEMILFMDGRGDPYGTNHTLDRNQHSKALHLTPFVATVQRGAEVLQVLADDLAKPRNHRPTDKFSGLWTQLPIPTAAEVWWGDAPAKPGTAEKPALLPAGTPVFVRLGGVAVGVRFVLAEATDGAAAPIRWVQDDPKLPATHLTVVHAEGTDQGHGVVAVWLRVAEGLDDAGFAAFRRAFAAAKATAAHTGDTVAIAVAGGRSPLRIEANLAKAERRVLDGGEPDAPNALLVVNRRDLGREILHDWLPR